MATGILDVDTDTLALCASKLSVRDLANMAMSCRLLKDAAYADLPWQVQCRMRWPTTSSGNIFQTSSALPGSREAYLARHIASQQFRFTDPVEFGFDCASSMVNELLLDGDRALLAQGPRVLVAGDGSVEFLVDHTARVTCMRLYASEATTGMYRSSFGGASKFLATASSDHTIRIWGKKGSVFRTLRGHSGPVRVIADRLLPEDVLASGGMDGTVRLWSVFSSSRKRKALQATLHGHESYVKELVVSRDHLVSAAKDCKLRVWDPAASKPSCIGMIRGPGVPTGLKADGSLCYFAGGSAVVVIDLRTMQTVSTVARHENTVLAMALSPSASLLCTGGKEGLAKLWDIRKGGIEPVAMLGQHQGTVDFVHVDFFKAVTASREDSVVQVWDSRNGELITSLRNESFITAVAVERNRIATASYLGSYTWFKRRDYNDSAKLESENEGSGTSKFWDE